MAVFYELYYSSPTMTVRSIVCSSNACDWVGMQWTALMIFPVWNLVFFSRA